MVEAVCLVFATVVGPQVEVCDISPKERVGDLFEPFGLELRPEMVEDHVCRWQVFAGVAQRRDQGSVGGRADENLVDILCIDFSVVRKGERHFLVKPVDEEGKKLVLVDFTVRLLFGGTSSVSRCLNYPSL